MSETILASASQKQVWISQYFMEYVRQSGFKPYIGKDPTSIIVTKYELMEEAGKTINVPFIGRLKGSGVTGGQILDGNEEELSNFNCAISVNWRRNAVRVPKSQQFMTEINLLNAAKGALKMWEADKLRTDIINAMMAACTGGTNGDTTVAWSATAASDRNAFAAGNSDRLLFGHTKSNYSATWATAVGNITTASDTCSAAAMSLAKRMAKTADAHITPYKTADGREYFVAFHGQRTFRDIKNDSTMTNANREARAREGNGMDKNPLFQDGDIIYDGVIHREIPELDAACTAAGNWDGTGGSSCDVRPVFVCGAASVAIAWGQEPTPRTDYIKDFGFRPGVAIEELLGVQKIAYNGKQNGMVTAMFAAASD